MPVTPPVEQEFLNVHKYVADSEIHPPLGYRTGNVETYPVKTIHGELVWNNNLMQKPVIGFLNLGSSVSPSDGDRYIATGVGSSADYAGAIANDIIDYLTIDSYGQTYNQWDKRTPNTGMLTYMSGTDTFYYFDGSIWKELSSGVTPTDKDNATATLNGTANNGADGDYVDLFTPATGKIFESVFTKATSLTPSDANISIVLHDGTPANDIELVPAVSVDELNIGLSKFGCNGEVVTAGYSLKLLVTGNDASGVITVVANYLI